MRAKSGGVNRGCRCSRGGKLLDTGVVTICQLAAVVGLEPSLAFHRRSPAIRDKGHQALIGRLMKLLSPAWTIFREAPFPGPNDPRFWDLLLRLPAQLVGVEAETRIRDFQELVRRMRGRTTDGGTDVVLLILSDTGHNRGLVDDLRAALGPEFATPAAALLGSLRAGEPLPGSGVVLF